MELCGRYFEEKAYLCIHEKEIAAVYMHMGITADDRQGTGGNQRDTGGQRGYVYRSFLQLRQLGGAV